MLDNLILGYLHIISYSVNLTLFFWLLFFISDFAENKSDCKKQAIAFFYYCDFNSKGGLRNV